MITLEQLLASRDARAQHQRDLLAAWPGHTLICLTVQFPGPVKRSASTLIVGGAGMAALLDKFGIWKPATRLICWSRCPPCW